MTGGPSSSKKSETATPVIQQNSVNTLQNMNFKVSFSLRFGKLGVDSNPRRKRKTISSDDLKDGGGDMGGVEAPAAGGGSPRGPLTWHCWCRCHLG